MKMERRVLGGGGGGGWVGVGVGWVPSDMVGQWNAVAW